MQLAAIVTTAISSSGLGQLPDVDDLYYILEDYPDLYTKTLAANGLMIALLCVKCWDVGEKCEAIVSILVFMLLCSIQCRDH